jgi:hypothetical protein
MWRRRKYLGVPSDSFGMWWRTRFRGTANSPIPFRLAWSIAVGTAHLNMNWVYDFEIGKEKKS